MAKGLDQMARGAPPPEEEGEMMETSALAADEELDADIAFGLLGSLLYSDEGSNQMLNALSAQNPAPVLGNFLASAMDRINQKLNEKGMDLSPNIWLAEGGVVDRVMDEVAELAAKGGAGEFNDGMRNAVFSEVVDQLKLAGQANAKGASAPPAGPPPGMGAPMGAPPMPMGGAMPTGGAM